MRWKTDQLPKDGEWRVVSKFLWFPKELHNECRWLEFALIRQQYDDFGYDSGWINKEWVNKK